MKLLTVSALLCAMMALTTAADLNVEKRQYGWIRYGDRYYHYFPYRKTWHEAQKYCESKNANLASVRNLGEYREIQRIIYRATQGYAPTWIGGYYAQQDHRWYWIDGTSFSYAYWCRGEPNNTGGKESFLHMNWTGHRCMNDIPGDYRYPFVCVWKNK